MIRLLLVLIWFGVSSLASAAVCVSNYATGGRTYLIADTTRTPPNCLYGVLFQNADYGPLSSVVSNPAVIQDNVTYNPAFLDLVANQPTVDWSASNFNTLDWYVQNRAAIETMLANNPGAQVVDSAKAAQLFAWGFSFPLLVYFWSWAAGEIVRLLRDVLNPSRR